MYIQEPKLPLEMANALIFAARDGDVTEVRWRLEAKATLATYADSHGQTALMWAAVQGHTEVARCLLDFGAALDGTEWEMGRTALYMAAGRGHVTFVELLLSRGANPSLRRTGGRTPLGIAAYNGHNEVVKLLLSHEGCDVDGRDDQGCTPLWQAARNGRTQALRLLLAAGADPSIPGEQGWQAIDVAREKDRAECISLLEGEERAYVLSKIRRLWREEHLQAGLERGRVVRRGKAPPFLVNGMSKGEGAANSNLVLLRGGGAGSARGLVRGEGGNGGGNNIVGSDRVRGDGGAASSSQEACQGLPRVETEEDDEHGLKSRAPDSAKAAAHYVVEQMRFDVFIIMRDLLALSSTSLSAPFG